MGDGIFTAESIIIQINSVDPQGLQKQTVDGVVEAFKDTAKGINVMFSVQLTFDCETSSAEVAYNAFVSNIKNTEFEVNYGVGSSTIAFRMELNTNSVKATVNGKAQSGSAYDGSFLRCWWDVPLNINGTAKITYKVKHGVGVKFKVGPLDLNPGVSGNNEETKDILIGVVGKLRIYTECCDRCVIKKDESYILEESTTKIIQNYEANNCNGCRGNPVDRVRACAGKFNGSG